MRRWRTHIVRSLHSKYKPKILLHRSIGSTKIGFCLKSWRRPVPRLVLISSYSATSSTKLAQMFAVQNVIFYYQYQNQYQIIDISDTFCAETINFEIVNKAKRIAVQHGQQNMLCQRAVSWQTSIWNFTYLDQKSGEIARGRSACGVRRRSVSGSKYRVYNRDGYLIYYDHILWEIEVYYRMNG